MLEEEVYSTSSPIWDPDFSQSSAVPSWMSPNSANAGWLYQRMHAYISEREQLLTNK